MSELSQHKVRMSISRITTCPNCSNKGEVSIDGLTAFDVRGQLDGKAVWKCNSCGCGLLLGLFSGGLFGSPRIIPNDMWRRMQEERNRNFNK